MDNTTPKEYKDPASKTCDVLFVQDAGVLVMSMAISRRSKQDDEVRTVKFEAPYCKTLTPLAYREQSTGA